MGQLLVSRHITFTLAFKLTLPAAEVFEITMLQHVPVQVTLEGSFETTIWFLACQLLSILVVCLLVFNQI